MNKRHLLSIAVATALTGSINVAQAAVGKVIDLSQGNDPIVIASENPSVAAAFKLGTNTIAFTLPTRAHGFNKSTKRFIVDFYLKNGVQFKSTDWEMQCYVKTAASSGYMTIVRNILAGNNAVFRTQFTGALVQHSAKSGCVITGLELQLSSGLKEAEYSATVSYEEGGVFDTVAYTGKLITLSPSLITSFDKSNTNATIDVTKGSKVFTDDTDVGPKTAYLGKITYVTGGKTALTLDGGDNLDTEDALASLTVTLEGLPLGAVASSGGVYALDMPNCNTAGATYTSSLTKSVSNKVSFTLNSSTSDELAAMKNGVYFCLYNGNSEVMEKGPITATVTGTPQTGFRPTLGSKGNLVTITKNGTSTKILNIPSPDNASDTAFLRFNNMGSETGRVFGTLVGQDGKAIGTENVTLATLTPYGVIVLDSAAIATAFGVSKWTGRAWLKVDSELSKMSVQNLVRNNTSNTLLNLSESVTKQEANQ